MKKMLCRFRLSRLKHQSILLLLSSLDTCFCGGVPAVTHLLFVAAIRLIGVPAPSDGSSQAPMSPFTA